MFLLACHVPAACFTHAHSLRQSPAWPLPTQLRNLCSTADLLCDPEEVPPLSGFCCSLLSEWFIRQQRVLLPSAVCCSRQLLLRDKLFQSLAANTPVIWLLTVLQRGLGLLGSLAGLSQRPPSGTLGVQWGCPVRGGLAHTSEPQPVLSAAGAPVLLCPASPAGLPRLLWGPGAKRAAPACPCSSSIFLLPLADVPLVKASYMLFFAHGGQTLADGRPLRDFLALTLAALKGLLVLPATVMALWASEALSEGWGGTGATGPSQPPSNSPFPDPRGSRAHACAVRVLNEHLLCARLNSLSGGTEDACRLWDRLGGIWEGLEPEGLPRGS
ncbi:unnamed protein product [Gulo gulo]|uniref:Uncharacterized protein n=1 Tax=Gulo gulo TaxID=48420 RepID=A0A9X9LRC8_GULGU|nr:unnamed protein product [Gulo gulo]